MCIYRCGLCDARVTKERASEAVSMTEIRCLVFPRSRCKNLAVQPSSDGMGQLCCPRGPGSTASTSEPEAKIASHEPTPSPLSHETF